MKRRAIVLSMHAACVLAIAGCCGRAPTNDAPLDASASSPLASASAAPSASASAAADPNTWPAAPLIWETAQIEVLGETETWTARWREPPEPSCVEQSERVTCPCAGLWWGYRGKLTVERARPNEPTETWDFGKKEPLAIPGYPLREGDDEITDDDGKVVHPEIAHGEVTKRDRVRLFTFGDYDHDGIAAEFPMLVGYGGCGIQPGVLVGVSRARPHLALFGTAEDAADTFVLDYPTEWPELRDAKGKSVRLVNHACGDHGDDSIEELAIRFDAEHGLHVKSTVRACKP